MSKKTISTKSNKAISKTKINEKQRQNQLRKEVKEYQWKYQISRLQLMIEKQNRQRQNNENKIIQMIKHLQQTKKSKLPSQPDISIINKILSPTKKQKRFEIQQIVQCKNLISTIKSSTQIQLTNNNFRFNQIQKQIIKISNQNNILQSFQNNLSNLNSQFTNFYKKFQFQYTSLRKQIDHVKENISKFPQKLFNNLRSCLGQEIRRQSQVQRNFICNMQKQVNKKVDLVQHCAQVSMHTLNSLQKQVNITFQNLQSRVKIVGESVAQTKETIEEIYGLQPRSRDKFDSLSSFDCTAIQLAPKRTTQTMDKLQNFDSRILGLQRRMDLIYGEYLSRPLHKTYLE